tara:strand:- start:1501 stop:1710 length:210 start_codon:yes stop_codon:yes gene_type:complete
MSISEDVDRVLGGVVADPFNPKTDLNVDAIKSLDDVKVLLKCMHLVADMTTLEPEALYLFSDLQLEDKL